ncbi:MAG: nucleotidyl transferase AbiEii/AbiGii toxin family protein [Planctomycetia bacterium]|nr:nucleotidyl transferase AbiEii/AbiGii toxin family protein [Planctomycetia bacterium]
MERFLYRLARSRYSQKFVLKGALMFNAWGAPESRPTKDIDLLARMTNRIDVIARVVRDVCSQPVESDGLIFDQESIEGIKIKIKEAADYSGVRVTLNAFLEKARVRLQIDVGFGDVIVPRAEKISYPTILDFPAPNLAGYTRETAIAEKFEAMVKLAQINSRMKDFFDIWLLSRQFDFNGKLFAKAVATTFAKRKTPINPDAVALTQAFGEDAAKKSQWQAFLRRSRIADAPQTFSAVVAAVAAFLLPVAKSIHERKAFDSRWTAPGPWQGRG